MMLWKSYSLSFFYLQLKLTKKSKSKGDEKQPGAVSSTAPLDSGILQEELQKKIIENAQFASQVNVIFIPKVTHNTQYFVMK